MCTPRESELMWNFSLVVAHCMTSQDFGAGCSWEFWMSGQLQCTHTNTHTHTHTHTYKHTNKHTHYELSSSPSIGQKRYCRVLCLSGLGYRVSDLWLFMLGLVGCFAHVSVVLLCMNRLNSHRDESGYHCWLYLETLIISILYIQQV